MNLLRTAYLVRKAAARRASLTWQGLGYSGSRPYLSPFCAPIRKMRIEEVVRDFFDKA